MEKPSEQTVTAPTNAPENRIRQLNDAMRRAGPFPGRWMMTQGVIAQGPEFILLAVRAIQAFSAFDADNDPYAAHDFGALEIEGEKLFWKIDYYDKSLEYGSEDPADPNKTARILTVMMASEY